MVTLCLNQKKLTVVTGSTIAKFDDKTVNKHAIAKLYFITFLKQP